jgi:magnesium transporter
MHVPKPSGADPDTMAASALSAASPTNCQARTRLYRGGELAAEGFAVAEISDYLATDESAVIWLDLRNPDRDDLEDQLFAQIPQDMAVQRHSFQLRKSLVLLRRIIIPMRDVVGVLMRGDMHLVSDEMAPYYQDVYDHVLRASEWADSLRDLVTTILETNLTIQGNRMNVITKKVTSWAAIIAVPTLITGFYGMNVPYPGIDSKWGFVAAMTAMVVTMVVLFYAFRRRDWL